MKTSYTLDPRDIDTSMLKCPYYQCSDIKRIQTISQDDYADHIDEICTSSRHSECSQFKKLNKLENL